LGWSRCGTVETVPFQSGEKANAGPSTPLRFAQDDSSLLIAQDDGNF
jgi:hypothetical protein